MRSAAEDVWKRHTAPHPGFQDRDVRRPALTDVQMIVVRQPGGRTL
jgi:hypothetical protein